MISLLFIPENQLEIAADNIFGQLDDKTFGNKIRQKILGGRIARWIRRAYLMRSLIWFSIIFFSLLARSRCFSVSSFA